MSFFQFLIGFTRCPENRDGGSGEESARALPQNSEAQQSFSKAQALQEVGCIASLIGSADFSSVLSPLCNVPEEFLVLVA